MTWQFLYFVAALVSVACVDQTRAWSWLDDKVGSDSTTLAYQVPPQPDVPLPLHLYRGREGNWTNGPSEASDRQISVAKDKAAALQVTLERLKEENAWKNDLVLFLIPSHFRNALPRIVQSWLRNYLACVAVYLGVSGAWAYYVYWVFGYHLYGAGNMPAPSDIVEQARVAMCSIPGYAVLPAVTEALVERGWTRAYARIGDVGLWHYIAYFAVYMACVEFGVYWMHRLLHDIRVGYRTLHYIHHKYNKEHSLSPFAGLAFHPIDGIIQALPYCVLLLVVPMHFLTHELMLFMTGVWTTNIHDCLHARIAPIMGAGYHTIHHTTYLHNYGHYFIYMDKLFGTLEDPDEFAASQKKRQKAQ